METRLYLLRDGSHSLSLRHVFRCERAHGWRRTSLSKKGGKGTREYPYDALTVEEAKIHCIKPFGKIAKTTKENRCYLGHTAWFTNNETKSTTSVNVESNSPLKQPSKQGRGERKRWLPKARNEGLWKNQDKIRLDPRDLRLPLHRWDLT